MLIEAAKGGHFDIMNLLLDWPTSGDRGTSAGGQTSSQSGSAEPTSKVSILADFTNELKEFIFQDSRYIVSWTLYNCLSGVCHVMFVECHMQQNFEKCTNCFSFFPKLIL